MVPRKARRTGLIVRHAAHDRPPAPSRRAATHKFASGPYRRMFELLRRSLWARVFEGGIVSAIEQGFIGTVPRRAPTALQRMLRRLALLPPIALLLVLAARAPWRPNVVSRCHATPRC
jgi:hypothetical protein